MAALDTVNYAIRPNKNIERKVVFEALSYLEADFPFAAYRYVGFGSLWFSDFVLAHQSLGISDLISIQKGQALAARARFNAPYGCIKVIEGEFGALLSSLKLDERPAILWLDYESRIGAVLEELALTCERLPSGSVLLVTINASKDAINAENEAARRAKQEEAFREDVGQLAPAAFPADFFDRSKYPNNLAQTLMDHLERATRKSGRDERFVPLMHFSYSDNAPMITVGGMIANRVDSRRLERANIQASLDFVRGRDQVTIAAPPLTTREKLALDRLLPRPTPPDAATLSALGLPLKEAQIAEYHRHYLRYPVFAEMVP